MKRLAPALVTSGLFAGSYVAGRFTTVDLGPLTASFLRYLVALAVLGTLSASRGTGIWKVRRAHVPGTVLLGAFGILGYHYFFFASLRHTAVANTAIINAFSPVVTGALAAGLLGERLARTNYLGMLAAVVGVLLLLTGGEPGILTSLEINVGDALMLVAVLCWGLYSILLARLLEHYSALTLTLHATVFGVLMMIPLAVAEGIVTQVANVSRISLISVLYMGVCGSALGYLLYNRSVRLIGPTRTSSLVYSVVPVLVAGLAFAFFDEPITMVMAVSTALIVVGLRLTLSERKAHR